MSVLINIYVLILFLRKIRYGKVAYMFQLRHMQKCLASDIPATVYNQTVLPFYDYADFVVESGPNHRMDKLDSLH